MYALKVLFTLSHIKQEDRPAVALLIDEVDGSARHLAAPGQRGLVGAQAVHSRPAEGRDEGGVDIQDAAGIGLDDAGA